MDSYPFAALVHVRIFCRCYSLVLNVDYSENPETPETDCIAQVVDPVPHTGLSC